MYCCFMQTSTKVKDLNKQDQPREKLLKFGADVLTDAELLAIILRTGGKDMSVITLSQALLSHFKGYKGIIDVPLQQLTKFKNIGHVKAVTVKALCEIALRFDLEHSKESTKQIKTASQVYKLIRKNIYGKKKEHLYVISLDSRNSLIAVDLISIGTLNETLANPREIFRQALMRNAVSIILVHNHPSNNITPSSDDILLTERLINSGNLIEIKVLDHIIATDSKYCSMKSLNLFSTKKNSSKVYSSFISPYQSFINNKFTKERR